jgi:hypothetical protein
LQLLHLLQLLLCCSALQCLSACRRCLWTLAWLAMMLTCLLLHLLHLLLLLLLLLQCFFPQAMFVDFGMAVQYAGVCYLRYDDTNPEAEKQVGNFSIIDVVPCLSFG